MHALYITLVGKRNLSTLALVPRKYISDEGFRSLRAKMSSQIRATKPASEPATQPVSKDALWKLELRLKIDEAFDKSHISPKAGAKSLLAQYCDDTAESGETAEVEEESK